MHLPPDTHTSSQHYPIRGNTYEGFFLDHNRSGTGTLFRGNVKRVYDPRSGRKALRSNRIYEGTWRANELRTGSMVSLNTYNTDIKNEPPTNSTPCRTLESPVEHHTALPPLALIWDGHTTTLFIFLPNDHSGAYKLRLRR